jgi:lysophospholipid hydrolase
MEENNRLVIYQADPKYTWWTRLCIQQADCILLLVNSDRAPQGKCLEQSLAWAYQSMDVRIDLVVVGQKHKPPTSLFNDDADDDFNGEDMTQDDEKINVSDQLNNWSEQRKWISGHHLVRAPIGRYKLDFHRLCRRVTGRAIGLVLGAGGARGLAHLGVIRALKEAGMTIDLVGGTSQGAFVGALYARQPDDLDGVFSECRKMANEMSSLKSKLLDLTLPMTSIFSGRMFNRGIRKRLGKIRIQDLVLNFFCNSVRTSANKHYTCAVR